MTYAPRTPGTLVEAFELFVRLRREGATLDAAEYAASLPQFEPALSEALSALLALELLAREQRAGAAEPGEAGPPTGGASSAGAASRTPPGP